jgi:ABC-type antimicrobial peptide transport system permease subunit
MMPIGKLGRLVVRSASRNLRHAVLSGFGIVVGIAAFVFFLGLSSGVRAVVLGEMFPLDRVEVVAPKTARGVLAGGASTKIDDATVARIRAWPGGAAEVVPRMAIGFPSTGRVGFMGNQFTVELVGDGIDPSYLRGEPFGDRFRDYESPEERAKQVACTPPENRCPDDHDCGDDGKCHHRVPVVISRNLVEIYNTTFAESRGLPTIGAFEEAALQRALKFSLQLGNSMLGVANVPMKAPPKQLRAVLLGITDKAAEIGATVPIGYVKRWNQEYLGDEAASSYSSVVVRLASKEDVGAFGAWVNGELGLELKDSNGERFALIILIVTSLFMVIALAIVSISAINIAHNFFMQVSERKREIGVLRAIGATRGDIRGLILGEAALIGVVAGGLGIGLAIGLGALVDVLAARYLPDFPFKPTTYFDFAWWIWSGGLGFSVLFCILGGVFPAARAAGMAPAQALTQQ